MPTSSFQFCACWLIYFLSWFLCLVLLCFCIFIYLVCCTQFVMTHFPQYCLWELRVQ